MYSSITLLTFFLLIIFSIFGYGLFVRELFIKNNDRKISYSSDYSFVGFYGIFFLILVSYITSLFFKHGIIHNTLILIFGLIFFLLKAKWKKNNLKIILLFSLINFINLIVFKNHDDFSYYHFPYTYYLVKNSHELGLGIFNLGFRTPSSIFFLNSLFYLPAIKEFSFNIGQGAIFLFANFYFFLKIKEYQIIPKKKFHLVFSLLAFGFINIFFYRLSEHGTDRSAQILIFILINEILEFLKFKKEYIYNYFFFKISVLLLIIISLKAFYILYSLFIIPIIFVILKEKKVNYIKKIFFSKNFLTLTLFFFSIFLIYFLNTGCIIYPITFTCFNNLQWSLGIDEVERLRMWYEQWSKAGAGPNFRVENPNDYIKNFNWLGNWINNYFFNKVSDFLYGLAAYSIIFYLIFYKCIKFIKKDNLKEFYFILFVFLIILIEWFINHPSLRYGGYCIISSILFIFLSSKFIFKNNKFLVKKTATIFIILIFIIGGLRNINRISNEVKKYNYEPFKNIFYKTTNRHYRIENEIQTLKKNISNCKNTNLNYQECSKISKNIIQIKYLRKNIYFKKND